MPLCCPVQKGKQPKSITLVCDISGGSVWDKQLGTLLTLEAVHNLIQAVFDAPNPTGHAWEFEGIAIDEEVPESAGIVLVPAQNLADT